MKTDYYSITNVGLRRKNNEDYLMVEEGLDLYILADGMGGHQGGEIASRMTVEAIKDFFEQNPTISEEEMNKLQEFPDDLSLPARKLSYSIINANGLIIEESGKDSELTGMGTTVVAVHGALGNLYLAHVGDSRIYLSRNGSFRQMTEDHSVYNEERKRSMLTDEQLKEMPFAKRLVRAIGHMDRALVDIKMVSPEKGDILLLCSDGLTDMVEDDEISETLSKHGADLKTAGDTLVQQALDNGGSDNVTIILLRIDER